MWDDRFTAVEFFNDSSFEENGPRVTDWFSFLRAGRRVFAVGSSDSHSINGSPVGYPRTCMLLGTSDPRAATPQAIGRAVGEGQATSPAGSSSTSAAPGAEGDVRGVRSRGSPPRARRPCCASSRAAWVRARGLVVYVDGAATPAVALGDAQRNPMDATVRYRGEVRVPVSATGSRDRGGERRRAHAGVPGTSRLRGEQSHLLAPLIPLCGPRAGGQ
ncbi:MAG: hypothetical protein U0325_01370 [Polyangiales bacterium]